MDEAGTSLTDGDDGHFTESVEARDPELAAVLGLELGRLRDTIELIASENVTSKAVLQSTGSVLTNKYAEGYPGRRYYGGCEYVDVAEDLAIERAKKLFNCGFANVQPHAGAQANLGSTRHYVNRMIPLWGCHSRRGDI